MHYRDLALLLQGLEQEWRARSSPPNPARHPSHRRIRDTHNVQYFALSDRTIGQDCPIVVSVGVNYTQGAQPIPDQIQDPRHVLTSAPRVEDRVNEYERAYLKSCHQHRDVWVNSALCSPVLPPDLLTDALGEIRPYHLVMTNLSPWITTDSWSTIAAADGQNLTADLLVAAPAKTLREYAHIFALKKRLKAAEMPVVWIGHGKDFVWEHFRGLMRQLDLENWMLAANLAYPISSGFLDKPRRFTGGNAES